MVTWEGLVQAFDLPKFFKNNLANERLTDIKFVSQLPLTIIAIFVLPIYFLNLSIGKFGRWVTLSRGRAASCPALFVHIINIVKLCSNKQMLWVYTRRIVAFVQNAKSIWNGPVVNFPRNSMRLKIATKSFVTSTRSAFGGHFSITTMRFGPKPWPTFAGLFNFAPESLLETFWLSHDFSLLADAPQVKGRGW